MSIIAAVIIMKSMNTIMTTMSIALAAAMTMRATTIITTMQMKCSLPGA